MVHNDDPLSVSSVEIGQPGPRPTRNAKKGEMQRYGRMQDSERILTMIGIGGGGSGSGRCAWPRHQSFSILCTRNGQRRWRGKRGRKMLIERHDVQYCETAIALAQCALGTCTGTGRGTSRPPPHTAPAAGSCCLLLLFLRMMYCCRRRLILLNEECEYNRECERVTSKATA